MLERPVFRVIGGLLILGCLSAVMVIWWMNARGTQSGPARELTRRSMGSIAITVEQTEHDYPFAVQTFEEVSQIVAQTFRSPSGGRRYIRAVTPYFEYAMGGSAVIEIYQVSNPGDMSSGRLLWQTTLDATTIGKGFSPIPVDPPIETSPGSYFALVIGTGDADTSLGIAATSFTHAGNVYRDGAMFSGGNAWEDTGGDLAFRVVFTRTASSFQSRS